MATVCDRTMLLLGLKNTVCLRSFVLFLRQYVLLNVEGEEVMEKLE